MAVFCFSCRFCLGRISSNIEIFRRLCFRAQLIVILEMHPSFANVSVFQIGHRIHLMDRYNWQYSHQKWFNSILHFHRPKFIDWPNFCLFCLALVECRAHLRYLSCEIRSVDSGYSGEDMLRSNWTNQSYQLPSIECKSIFFGDIFLSLYYSLLISIYIKSREYTYHIFCWRLQV